MQTLIDQFHHKKFFVNTEKIFLQIKLNIMPQNNVIQFKMKDIGSSSDFVNNRRVYIYAVKHLQIAKNF